MKQNKSKPIKTVALMMAATVIAKTLGLIRNMLLAPNYGIGTEANAFSAAANIPLNFFDLLFSAAVLGSFIPVYNSFKAEENSEADEFASVFYNVILFLTGLLALAGIIFAVPIINIMSPGLAADTKLLAADLLRIMFPMIIFTGMAYTLVGILQSKGKYLVPAFISAVSNAGVIIYLLFFNRLFGDKSIYGLAAAYLASWLIQLITLLIPAAKSGFKYRFIINLKNKAFLRVVKMALPIMIGSWLAPVTLLSGLFFAPYAGNITVFDYSYNLYCMTAGILTYSLCNYIFPLLSKLAASGGADEFCDIVRKGLVSAFIIIVPFMFGVMILSGEGVAVLYMRREFNGEAAYLTANALSTMAAGMPAYALIEICSRVFYSKNLYKIPMFSAVGGIAVNIISALILINIKISGVGAVGISAVTGQAAAAVILIIFIYKKIKNIINKKIITDIVKIFISGITSFIVMLALYKCIGNRPYAAETSAVKNILTAIAVFSAGAAVYIAGLGIAKVSDFKIFNKFKRGGGNL